KVIIAFLNPKFGECVFQVYGIFPLPPGDRNHPRSGKQGKTFGELLSGEKGDLRLREESSNPVNQRIKAERNIA
ncbi:MAG: hypothetical protein ABH845_02280, partial [Candidatus Omnitrophota bacterium]